ncbi:MAG: sigma-70 family RNA polymerase sigma factor [Anaerolineales bacterium]|nr:MAG: sigma-70 family RNA polymerase sigma factor [Anaerolineales bacterium]
MDEQALIRAAQRGDLDAFNRLILEYQTLAYNLALRVLGDDAGAADATQDAFLLAYRGLRRFRGGSFRSWLLRIVTNACFDEIRRRKRRPAASLDELEADGEFIASDAGSWGQAPADLPEEEAMRAELRRAIEACLGHLPDDFRVVAVLVDIQGHDYQAASEVIGKPVGTVKSRLARARERMRHCLEGRQELFQREDRLEDEGKS